MKRGLVFGKFLPLHNGHVALVDFARLHCDELIVLVCAANGEPVDGETRLAWLRETFAGRSGVRPELLKYDDRLLPNTSESSVEVSRIWAAFLREYLPPVDIIATSEPYGDFVAEFWGCQHLLFDNARLHVPVSATAIRNDPFAHWHHIPPAVRPHYVKKVCIVGTESTGKSILARDLAKHFCTDYVPEMAREIVSVTDECTEAHLVHIAELHTATIRQKLPAANRLLFIDTDITITRSYSRFLFGKEMVVDDEIEKVNQCDLYLYLDRDAPYVQDGTRLIREQRDLLDASHRAEFEMRGQLYTVIGGNWEERFVSAVRVVESFFGLPHSQIPK